MSFEDYYELAEYVIKSAKNKKKSVTLALFYDEAVEVVKNILNDNDVIVKSMEISDEEISDYEKEYYITLDEEMELYVQPAYSEKSGCYLYNESDIVIFDKNVDEEILDVNPGAHYTLSFSEEDENECGDCCEDCATCPHKELSEKIHGFLDFVENIIDQDN